MNLSDNSNCAPNSLNLDDNKNSAPQRPNWLTRQVATLGRAMPPAPEPVEPLSAHEIFHERLQQAIQSTGYSFTILDEVVERYPELTLLVLYTESMNNEEKQYWLDILLSMTDEQIDRLFNILQSEQTKLAELTIKYHEEVKELNRIHRLHFNWLPRLSGADGRDLLGVLQSGKSGVEGGAVVLGQDGRILYLGTHLGHLIAWDLTKGKKLWHKRTPLGAIYALALSPDDTHLASASGDKTVRIWDSKIGDEIHCLVGHKTAVQCLAFSPDGAHLASGSQDQTVILWGVSDGTKLKHWTARSGSVLALAFSPYGLGLASGSSDGIIRMRDPAAVVRSRRSAISKQAVCAIAFCGSGQHIATVTEDNVVRLWHGKTHAEVGNLPEHDGMVTCLAFSPDGQRLATAQSGQGRIRIWQIESWTELQHVRFPENRLSGLVWAPNGSFLVACVCGNMARIFDTRTPEMRAVPDNTPAHFFSDIAHIWATLHSVGIAAPLSLLDDLNKLLAIQTQGKLQSLQRHPGLTRLQLLRWPEQARIGLIALLLNRWPEDSAWQPTSNAPTAVLRKALLTALASSIPGPPETPPPPPLVWLDQVLDLAGDRLLTLLVALGPQAIAADPGLALRLLAQLEQVNGLTQIQRKDLGLRLATQQTGQSQSSSTGSERSGFSSIGPITALLPSQWAYSRQLLYWQYQNGGLLYRTRIGREQPHLPPVVILLDTSPACWGAIEAITRPAAHALAETLASQNRPTVLLTAGDNQVHYLNRPEERLKIFTHRSMKAVDVLLALEKAQALRRELRVDGVEPLIVLLTHCWWGADSGPCKPQPRLRALLVQFPGDVVQPRIAAHFERCEAVAHNQFSALASVLERLIT